MDLCIDCLNDMPWLSPVAGQFPLPGAPCRPHVCTAAMVYAPPVDVLVTDLKFRGQRHCGRVLGELLGIIIQEQVATGSRQQWPDCLVPVPLHPRRMRERGYNQAESIARSLGSVLELPVATGLLTRPRETFAQSRLGRARRLQNAAQAFVASDAVQGQHIALIDDVVTTGATLQGCADAVFKAGAATCESWVVARTLLTSAVTQVDKGSKV